jgi:hypothetical protein
MLEGKRMRTYDYYALLHEEDEEIQHGQPLIRKNSNVHLRHRSRPLEAGEEVRRRKTEVEDER